MHDAMAKMKYDEEISSRIITADTLQSCTENKFKHSFHFVPLALSVKCGVCVRVLCCMFWRRKENDWRVVRCVPYIVFGFCIFNDGVWIFVVLKMLLGVQMTKCLYQIHRMCMSKYHHSVPGIHHAEENCEKKKPASYVTFLIVPELRRASNSLGASMNENTSGRGAAEIWW